jgi:hypothetical protein
LKNESVAVFGIVLVLVTAAVGVVSWNGRSATVFAGSTTTTTQTISCPTLNSTQTSGNGSVRFPNYGPLLGNLSAISIVENVYGSSGNFATSVNLLVLNRSLTSSRPVYLVNVTMKEVSSNVAMVSVNDFTTTTSTTSGTQTQMGSVMGLVVSNGSMVSVERSSGIQLTSFPLDFFEPFVSLNSISNYALHPLNSTVVTIGSTRMVVTNYELLTLVSVELLEGCGSETSSVSTVAAVINGVFQAGRVPGTDFTLITLISERFAFLSNSSSPSGLPPATITEQVTSFSVG